MLTTMLLPGADVIAFEVTVALWPVFLIAPLPGAG